MARSTGLISMVTGLVSGSYEQNIEAMRGKRARLAEKLAASEQELSKHRHAAAEAEYNEENDSALSRTRTLIRDASDRVDSLQGVVRRLDAEIANAERVAAEQEAQAEREEAASEIDALRNQLADITPVLLDDLNQTAALTGRAGGIVFEARQLSEFVLSLRGEFSRAFDAVDRHLTSAADHVRSGYREPVRPVGPGATPPEGLS